MIKIEHLTKSFRTSARSHVVFEDLNLSIKNGTFFGIAGKSGAGKSTLLSIVAGLQKADSGRVVIDGTDIFTLDDDGLSLFRNKHIGFVSQEQSFLENLTVLDNVRLPYFFSAASIQKEETEIATARALELLESLGIKHLAKSYPQELSGGENHRVLIARALMNNPSVIVADEPTESVDREQTEAIITIFRRLAEEGKIIILVSHDEQALRLCDEVFHLT